MPKGNHQESSAPKWSERHYDETNQTDDGVHDEREKRDDDEPTKITDHAQKRYYSFALPVKWRS